MIRTKHNLCQFPISAEFGHSRGHLCERGDGEADWPNLLGMLQERDYRGDFLLDQTPRGDPEWELERGLKMLRSM